MNICRYISNNAEHHPDKPALIEQGRELSYQALDNLVRRTAAHLKALGVCESARVGLCLRDDIDHLIILLGVIRLGGVVVAIEWRSPIAERTRVAKAFDLSVVLFEADIAPPVVSADTIPLDAVWHDSVNRATAIETMADNGALPLGLLATSGTTGQPKGISVTHDQTFARFVSSWLAYGWQRGDVYFAATSFSFAVGREYALFHLIAGNTIVLSSPMFAPSDYVEAVNRSGATVAFMVPTVVRSMLREAGNITLLPHLRVLCVSGDMFDGPEKDDARRLISPHLHEVYGTAGVGAISVLIPRDMPDHSGSVGRPLPTVEVEIVDNEGRTCAAGEDGLIRVRGAGVADGFYGAAEAEAVGCESFSHGWYYPGDVGILSASGYLSLRGRIGDVVVRDGANVSIREVEAVLRTHSAVAEAAIVAQADGEHGKRLVALVVTLEPVSSHALLAHCRRNLASFKMPNQVVFVDALPNRPMKNGRKLT